MPSTKDRRTSSSNYRKPPVAHQFKKGTSGNPNGRPRKKAVQPGFGALGGGIADRLGAMALDEAIRPVTVREGDKVSEIPAMQALIRTMFRAAAQGDTKAGRQLLSPPPFRLLCVGCGPASFDMGGGNQIGRRVPSGQVANPATAGRASLSPEAGRVNPPLLPRTVDRAASAE